MTVTPGPILPHKSNHQSLCGGAVYPRTTSFPPEEAPRSIHKGHTSIRKSCKGEKGKGVSRPDIWLIGCFWIGADTKGALYPSLSPSAFLFPSTFAAPPSSRARRRRRRRRCGSCNTYLLNSSLFRALRIIKTVGRPFKFVPKNIWRLISTLSLSLSLSERGPLL